MTDQTCGEQEAVDERGVPPEQSRQTQNRPKKSKSQPKTECKRFSRKDLLKARTAVQPRQQQPQQQSKQKQQQLQVLHDVVRCVHSVLACRMTLPCWTSRLFKTFAAAMRSSNLDHEVHPLIDNISLRIHCALCSHSAEEISHKPMSVAEKTAMPLFDLPL